MAAPPTGAPLVVWATCAIPSPPPLVSVHPHLRRPHPGRPGHPPAPAYAGPTPAVNRPVTRPARRPPSRPSTVRSPGQPDGPHPGRPGIRPPRLRRPPPRPLIVRSSGQPDAPSRPPDHPPIRAHLDHLAALDHFRLRIRLTSIGSARHPVTATTSRILVDRARPEDAPLIVGQKPCYRGCRTASTGLDGPAPASTAQHRPRLPASPG
jgi:hypothetical protein